MIATLPRLFVTMLRYRVAMMIWLFMLLGMAYHGGTVSAAPDHLWAVVALASSYVTATCLNDVADENVDRVNHPGDAGRPLVTGRATKNQLRVLAGCASLMAVAAGAALGREAFAVVGAGLVVGHAYSLRPLRLSYRTWLAPLVLGVAYVIIPYALGSSVAGGSLDGGDAPFCGGLLVLFLARISLKDFRDRDGDSLYGKPTALLRFGKDAVCGLSLGCLIAGDALLVVALRPPMGVLLLLQIPVVAIGAMLFALRRASDPHSEQVAIGIGARMGNGLLVGVLAWLLVRNQGASVGEGVTVVAAITAIFAAAFVALVTSPRDVVIGYKG